MNKLAGEKSPYLLQHSENPVDWHPWGQQAFSKAKKEDKPIFLSIGYSTCHWCHVMEKETFSDPKAAERINETFVPIKVDREERPDLDAVYMKVSQLATGKGGWPLTVFLTPDKEPFFVATYIPRNSRFGIMGVMELCSRVSEMWKGDRLGLLGTAKEIMDALKGPSSKVGREMDSSYWKNAFEGLMASFDKERGGFGNAPKFPSPHQLLFLLRYWKIEADERALEMVRDTLEKMRLGGIYDHVGGGFHRYSTDVHWHLPHFEKMLYDQAMHLMAYTEGFQVTGDELFGRTASEIADYVLRDMTTEEGLFMSAEDADSEGEEGLFYTWTADELVRALGKERAGKIMKRFGVEKKGNFHDEATGMISGRNILHAGSRDDLEDVDEELKVLFDRREVRVRPFRDDKVLADWNGMMISAFSRSGQALGRKDHIEAAKRCADALLGKMIIDGKGLVHRYREDEASVKGFLDDHAFLSLGLMDLYEATFDPWYLEMGVMLVDTMVREFWDPEKGGFFRTSHTSEDLIHRDKDGYDGAYPSGNSAAMWALVRAARFTGRTELEDLASGVGQVFSGSLSRNPWAHTYMLCAHMHASGPAREILIVGGIDEKGTEEMIRIVRDTYLPSRVVVQRDDREENMVLDLLSPPSKEAVRIEGEPTVYACKGWNCDVPTNDPEGLRKSLEEI